MITIERHAIDQAFAAEQVSRLSADEKVAIERTHQKPAWMPKVHRIALMHTQFRSVLNPTASAIEVWDSIVLATQSATAILVTGMVDGGGANLLIGKRMQVPALGSHSYTGPTTWLTAHHLAVICRETKLIEILCSVPQSVLRSSESSMDEFAYLWVETLRAYWRQDKDVLTKLNTALAATDPEILTAPVDLVLQHYYPTMKLFHFLVQQDADGVNAGLVEALELHKKYWGSGERAKDPLGFLALGPLAMASLAYDLKLGLTVESDYLPKQLIEGTWVGEYDT